MILASPIAAFPKTYAQFSIRIVKDEWKLRNIPDCMCIVPDS